MTALTDPTKGDFGHANAGHGRFRLHRLGGGGPAGRRRAPGDGGRRPVDGAAGEPGRRARLRAGRAGRDRPGRPGAGRGGRGRGPRSSTTWPPRSTCAAASPTRCTTPGSTCSAPSPWPRRPWRPAAGGWSSPAPAGPCTASPTRRPCRSTSATRRGSPTPTGCRSGRPRTTWPASPTCTGWSRSACGWGTSTGPARTRTARPGWWPSSATGCWPASR